MIYISISTVTPVYKGAETLRELISKIQIYRDTLEKMNGPIVLSESIFVDDGSIDGSSDVLIEIQNKYSWVKVVTLSRNFGQHSATVAGILHSSGDWIVTLDEDLQHNPEFIHQMLYKAVSESNDIVYANSSESIHNSFLRDYSSKFIKLLLSKVTGNKSIVYYNSFRVIRGSIGRVASAVSIDQTYFDVALSWFTQRVSTIELPLKDMRFIKTNKSGYSFSSLFSHARRLIQTSNIKILRLSITLGFMLMLIGLIGAIFVFVERIYFPELIDVQGWASLIITILIIGGFNSFLLGLVLENVAILLMQSHGKPKFFEVDRGVDKILLDWFELNK